MTKYILPLLISLSFFASIMSCGEIKTTEPYNYKVVSIESLEEMAKEKYDFAPAETIKIYQEIADRSRKIDNHLKAGNTNYEIAKIYELKFGDFGNAIKYGKESLVDWVALNNEQKIVDSHNYLGHLFVMEDNFVEAENSTNKALELADRIKHLSGTAEANLNLSKLNYKKGAFQTALSHYKSSKSFWMKDGDKTKIFENNLLGIELYKELGEDKLASKLLGDNKDIARVVDLPKNLMDLFESQVEIEDK